MAAQKMPMPLTYSTGFNLPNAILSAIGGGTYDALDLTASKGKQQLRLTRYGYGLGTLSGDTTPGFDSIGVDKKGVNLQRIPMAAIESGADVSLLRGRNKSEIKISRPSALTNASPTTKAAVAAAVAGLLIVGVAAWALR